MPARISATNKSKSSSKGRKTKQNRRKINSQTKKIIVFIFVSLLSAGFLGGYAFVNKLNKQFASAESSTSYDDSYSTMLFVIVDDFSKDTPTIKKLEYKVFDLENKKILSYNVDPTYKVELQGKFGNEPVSNFLALGALNDDSGISGGIKFVNKAVFNLFAFPVDKYVYVSEDDAWGWEGLFKDGQFWPLLVGGRGEAVQSNVQLDELYRLSTFISGLPEERITESEVGAGTDDSFREMTIGSRLAQEAKSIAVLNATSQGGVASFGARVIKNLGGRVVSVDNAENKFSEDFIVTDTPEDYTVSVLAKSFGISKVISKEAAKQYVTDNQLYRTDVLLILGK